MNLRFNEENKVILGAAGATAGTSDVNGAWIEPQGAGIAAVATITTANAANFIKWQHADATNQSDAADVFSSKVVSSSNGAGIGICAHNLTKRYYRAVIVRGASTATGDLFYLVHDVNSKPATGGITFTAVSNPVNGTA
jgi:hypothetical protein